MALLGTTGVVLSVASGWTTWDGMRNFTHEPVLSLMITFGIQGVMLIAAWLIGESFAKSSGWRRQHDDFLFSTRVRTLLSIAISVLLAGVLGTWVAGYAGLTVQDLAAIRIGALPDQLSGGVLVIVTAVLLSALIFVRVSKDLVAGYSEKLRTVARNAALWIMFLACMGTSVFFSFDSLFSTIFSDDERTRAAEVRARSAVSGIVSGIVAEAAEARVEERSALLGSAAWRQYDEAVRALVASLQSARASAERDLREEEQRRLSLSAQSQSQSLKHKRQVDALQQTGDGIAKRVRLLRDRADQLSSTVATLDQKIFEKEQDIVAATAALEAEERGIGVTSQPGRGPKYRELRDQLRKITEVKRNLELQRDGYRERLETLRGKIDAADQEAIATATAVARLRADVPVSPGDMEAARRAEQWEALVGAAPAAADDLRDRRNAFERAPTRANLAALRASCLRADDLLTRYRGAADGEVGCDQRALTAAAARLFALEERGAALEQTCAGGDRLPAVSDLDANLSFARRCLQDSGLSAGTESAFRARIDALERDRDDKAHRFVVSLNAFSDGNRLAYLALAIAVAIDALVFVSGLVGANVVRSPLSGVPLFAGRTASELETIIDNALAPDPYRSSTLALQTVTPVARRAHFGPDFGWDYEIDLAAVAPVSRQVLSRIVNAGASIGAVRRDEQHADRYQLRRELIEYLNQAARHAADSPRSANVQPYLQELLSTALYPSVAARAEIVLGYLQPTMEDKDYTLRLVGRDVAARDANTVMRCVNAAATAGRIRCVEDQERGGSYLLHNDVYHVLVSLAAEAEGGVVADTPQPRAEAVQPTPPPPPVPPVQEPPAVQPAPAPPPVPHSQEPPAVRVVSSRPERPAAGSDSQSTDTDPVEKIAAVKQVLKANYANRQPPKGKSPRTPAAGSGPAERQSPQSSGEVRRADPPRVAASRPAEPAQPRPARVSVSDDSITFD